MTGEENKAQNETSYRSVRLESAAEPLPRFVPLFPPSVCWRSSLFPGLCLSGRRPHRVDSGSSDRGTSVEDGNSLYHICRKNYQERWNAVTFRFPTLLSPTEASSSSRKRMTACYPGSNGSIPATSGRGSPHGCRPSEFTNSPDILPPLNRPTSVYSTTWGHTSRFSVGLRWKVRDGATVDGDRSHAPTSSGRDQVSRSSASRRCSYSSSVSSPRA